MARATGFSVAKQLKSREFWVPWAIRKQWIRDKFFICNCSVAYLTLAIGAIAQPFESLVHGVQRSFNCADALVAELRHTTKLLRNDGCPPYNYDVVL